MKASMFAALASATVTLCLAQTSLAQGRRVEDSNAGSANTSASTQPNATITNAGSGRASVTNSGTVSAHRERAWWEYAGVTPGSSEYAVLRRWARRRSRNGRVVVAWPGFQMTESGSRVFLAVSAVPRITPINEQGRLVYRLERASVPLSNNRRALETVAFATPVSRAYLRTRRGTVDLVIELRANGTQPTQSQQPGPDGITFLMFEFGRFALPEGSPTTTGATLPRTASASGNASSQTSVRPASGSNDSQQSIRPAAGSENTDTRADGADNERPPAVVR